MWLFQSKPAPQLTVGMPFDSSADVPIFPPAAMILTVLCAKLIGALTGKRLSFVSRFVPAPYAQPRSVRTLRTAVLAVGLAFTVPIAVQIAFLAHAGGRLSAAGSGTMFTPVGGLATDGVYAHSRNPMYAALIFMALPTMSVMIDSAWPVLLSPLTWYYLNYVVIAAEEALLADAFGAEYEAYCAKVPRWLI